MNVFVCGAFCSDGKFNRYILGTLFHAHVKVKKPVITLNEHMSLMDYNDSELLLTDCRLMF